MRASKITTDKVFEIAKYFGWHSDGGISVATCGYNDYTAKNFIPCSTIPRIDNYFTIHLVTEGKGVFIVNEHCFNVKKGDFFFLLPGTTVSYFHDKNEPWKYYWINIDGPQISNYISMLNLSPTRAVIPCPSFKKIKTDFEEILDPNFNLSASSFSAIALFYKILSYSIDKEVSPPFADTGLLRRVQTVVEFNYHNPSFNVTSIANKLFISHPYLCKKFKEQTGQTLVKYLVNYRLTKACELLSQRKYTNKELANSVGFNDEFHFMKAFKKKFGATIKEYQNNIINETE